MKEQNKKEKTQKIEKPKKKKFQIILEIVFWIFIFLLTTVLIFFIFFRLDFQKLPFLGKNIEKFSKTQTRIIQEQEVLFLQTASFNIDFLLKLETQEGSYLALYPYEVIMGIDAEKIIFTKDDFLNCELPAIEIAYSEIADNDSILEIKNTMKNSNLSYNTIISPIKKAFEQKAIDEALQNEDFVENFLSQIKNAIQNLYNEKINFVNEEAIKNQLKNSLVKIDTINLPAVFSLHKDFLNSFDYNEEKDFEKDFEKKFERDDLNIDALRFGLVKNFAKLPSISYASFKNKTLLKKENSLIASWVNPLDKARQKTYLFANEDGYEKAITLFQDGSISYLEAHGMNIDEKNAFYAYPLAYTALSLEYKPHKLIEKKNFQDYTQFIALYDNALSYLEEEKYTRFDITINQLKTFPHNENNSIKLLEAIYDAAVFFRYSPVNISHYENFNALLFLQTHLANLKHFNSEENRKNAIAELKKIANENNTNFTMQSLKALFLKNKKELNLKTEEIHEYENDIIESGLIVSKELFSSLDNEGRKTYLINTLEKIAKDKEIKDTLYFEEIHHSNFLFLDESYNELFIKNPKKIFEIQNRLERKLGSKPNFVVVFPQKKTFSSQYHCLVFEKDTLFLFENIASIFYAREPENIPYNEVSLSSRAFQIGTKTFEQEIILSLLQTIHNAYYFDNLYHIELNKSIRSQLLSIVKNTMERPIY